ncbi:uncharacterized protein LOC128236077 isoform X1 [Mya arenaria]|uniref:uncharacterized protein LOC128236077 isoform X1 n=1 Tax=Mya arenaria TaxID=6604 RepID=UPI0022E52D2C|nr:uncharacterized protein LOC128236077 isoform X1 [Mya arenaria]
MEGTMQSADQKMSLRSESQPLGGIQHSAELQISPPISEDIIYPSMTGISGVENETVVHTSSNTQTYSNASIHEAPGEHIIQNSSLSEVQGSYVSLLADIASIERNDELYSQTSSNQSTLGRNQTSAMNYEQSPSYGDMDENISSSLDNNALLNYGNLTYTLPSNGQTHQQFVILQNPITISSNIVRLLPSQMPVHTTDIDEDVTEDMTSVAHLQNLQNDQNFLQIPNMQNESDMNTSAQETAGACLVAGNKIGSMQNIQYFQDDSAIGTQITVTESEAVDKKQKKKPKKVQQSACEIKKFTAEDLNTGKTEKEMLDYFLEQTKSETKKNKLIKQREGEIKKVIVENKPQLTYSDNTYKSTLDTVKTTRDDNNVSDQKVDEQSENKRHNTSPSDVINELNTDSTLGAAETEETQKITDEVDNSVSDVTSEVQKKTNQLKRKSKTYSNIEPKHSKIVKMDKNESKGTNDQQVDDKITYVPRKTSRPRKQKVEYVVREDTSKKNRVSKKVKDMEQQSEEKQIVNERMVDVDLEKLINVSDCDDKYIIHLYPMSILDLLPETERDIVVEVSVDSKYNTKPFSSQNTKSNGSLSKYFLSIHKDTKRTVAKRLTRQRTRKDAKLEQSENEIDNQAKEDVNDSIDMDIWDELKSKQIDNQDSCETNTLVKHDDNPVKKDIAAETKIESVMKDGTVDDVETGGLQELEAEDLNTQGNTEGTKRIKKRGKQYTTVTNEDGKQFSCRHCVFTTPLREYLASHVRQLHMTSRHYQCETCGQTFRSHGNLAAHTRIHVGNYRFHCDRCPSKFTDQSNFLQHQRRHEGIKLHVCDHCGKSFVTSSDMRKHVRTHTGEHPFTCDQCGRTFKDGSSWKRHVKLHETDKNVFVCSLCRKRYSRIDLCNQHIKKTHANEPPGSVTSLILDAKTASSFPSESQTRSKKQMRSAQSIPFDTNFSPRESSLRQTFKSLTEVASQRLIQENYETTLHPSAVTDFSQRPFSVQSMTSYPLVTSLASLQTQNIPVTVDPFIFHQPRRDNVISYFMSTPKT